LVLERLGFSGLPTADAAIATAPVTAPVAVAATFRITRVATDDPGEADVSLAVSFLAAAAGFAAAGFFTGLDGAFVEEVLLAVFAGLAAHLGAAAFSGPVFLAVVAFFVTAVFFVVPPAALAICPHPSGSMIGARPAQR
jgi:hypothetical protein